MRRSIRVALTLGAAAASALLAACAGGGVSPAVQSGAGSLARTATRQAWAGWDAGARARSKVYVSVLGEAAVNTYDRQGHMTGQITGFGNPVGLAVDKAKNLYVADDFNNVIDVFKPGQHMPSTVLSDGSLSPVDVAVGADGTVYAPNITDGSPGSISVWAPGSTTPTATITDPNVFNFTGVALDGSNNLYATWYGSGQGGVDKVPSGSTTPSNLGLQGLAVPLDVIVGHRGTLVVADAACACVRVYPHGKTSPSRNFAGFGQPSQLAFDRKESTLFVTDSQTADVVVLNYANGNVKSTITSGLSASNYPVGVALSPPAPL